MILTNKSFIKLLLFFVVVFSFQVIVSFIIPFDSFEFKDIAKMHGFVFLITAIVIIVTNKITDKSPDKTGFVYLGFVLFKMIASVLFLYPYFSLPTSQSKIIVINFFIVFFIYIAYEATSVIKYLTLKQNKN